MTIWPVLCLVQAFAISASCNGTTSSGSPKLDLKNIPSNMEIIDPKQLGINDEDISRMLAALSKEADLRGSSSEENSKIINIPIEGNSKFNIEQISVESAPAESSEKPTISKEMEVKISSPVKASEEDVQASSSNENKSIISSEEKPSQPEEPSSQLQTPTSESEEVEKSEEIKSKEEIPEETKESTAEASTENEKTESSQEEEAKESKEDLSKEELSKEEYKEFSKVEAKKKFPFFKDYSKDVFFEQVPVKEIKETEFLENIDPTIYESAKAYFSPNKNNLNYNSKNVNYNYNNPQYTYSHADLMKELPQSTLHLSDNDDGISPYTIFKSSSPTGKSLQQPVQPQQYGGGVLPPSLRATPISMSSLYSYRDREPSQMQEKPNQNYQNHNIHNSNNMASYLSNLMSSVYPFQLSSAASPHLQPYPIMYVISSSPIAPSPNYYSSPDPQQIYFQNPKSYQHQLSSLSPYQHQLPQQIPVVPSASKYKTLSFLPKYANYKSFASQPTGPTGSSNILFGNYHFQNSHFPSALNNQMQMQNYYPSSPPNLPSLLYSNSNKQPTSHYKQQDQLYQSSNYKL